LGRVYAEALQVFPRRAGLWIEAASHEFFGPTKTIMSARILLQRGVRLNEKSEDLWVEYFSLELHYAQTLKGRRQILQGETQEPDENEYKIPGIVYKNAIKQIPDSIPFRLRFLDTCRRFPNTESLMDSIQSPLQKDFASQPEAWIARALYEAEKQSNSNNLTKMEQSAAEDRDGSGAEEGAKSNEDGRPSKKARTKDPVVAILEEAIESLASDDMYLQAFRFAQTYQSELERRGKEGELVQVQKFIDQLFEQASNHSSPDLALEQADYFMANDLEKKAVQVIKDFCTSKKSAPASMWIRWASMSPQSSMSILEKGLLRIPMSQPDHMNVLLQFFGSQMIAKKEDSKLFSTFQHILVLAPNASELVVEDVGHLEFGIESVAQAWLKYLEYASATNGLKSARKIYSAVLFQSSVEVNESNIGYIRTFIDKCAQLEGKDKTRLRRLYDKAVGLFEDTSLEAVYREERNEKAIYQ
jgi:U3 small nucleolar RNA-associated protein 6